MTSLLVLGATLAWGIPLTASPQNDDAYLGVIERLARGPSDADAKGDDVWARVAFRRARDGDWTPTFARENAGRASKPQGTPGTLPARIAWRACRDGRSLGTIVSARRPTPLHSELGTHALQATPRFVAAAPHDDRFEVITTGHQAARPFVISTLPDACAAGSSVRAAGAEAIARVTRLVLAQSNLHTGKPNRLLDARGWQAGDWTIVDLTLEEDGTWLAVVAFAIQDDVRYTVKGARVIDWIDADADAAPDVVLWIDGDNRSGYLLVYGKFEKQAAFEWVYR